MSITARRPAPNVLFTVLAALLCATTLARAAEPVTIVAFGDSTTAPRGKLTVYSTILQEELTPVRVINAGIGGHTTEMGRARFEKDVLTRNPRLAIVQFGINDSAVDVHKTPPATQPRVAIGRYEENLRYFVQTLKARGAAVILMTSNPLRWTDRTREMYGKPPYHPDDPEGFNLLLNDYCDVVRRVATEEKAELLDINKAFRAEAEKRHATTDVLLLDGMHPNEAGQRLVADRLCERIAALSPKLQLAITHRPGWQQVTENVAICADATDISLDTKYPTVLGCSLAKLADGAVMAIYSTPSSYRSAPGSTWIAQRTTRDGGKTWSPEREITRHPDCQASHPSVLAARDGALHVFYLAFKGFKWKDGDPTEEAQSDVCAVRSSDGGATWSTPQTLFDGYSGATNGAIETRDGRLLVPFSHYTVNPGRLLSRAVVSTDAGRTWALGTPIDIGGAGDHDGAIEPALMQLKDGRVWMLIRTPRGQFWESFSTDGGTTWSAAVPTKIEATSAPGHLTRLADDRLALVYNARETNRNVLHLAFSSDEGRTWSTPQAIAKGKQVTYPFIAEFTPGQLWIGYHDVAANWQSPRARHLRLPLPPRE